MRFEVLIECKRDLFVSIHDEVIDFLVLCLFCVVYRYIFLQYLVVYSFVVFSNIFLVVVSSSM